MALRVLEGKPLAAKMLVIGLIILGLMIPLSLLRGLTSAAYGVNLFQSVDVYQICWCCRRITRC
jgi:hypothetical protein